MRLASGDAGFLLTHFLAWFDKNIEDIEGGIFDDWGYAERPVRGGTDLSNHASGTAADANAVDHPLAARNTFTAAQAAKIRQKLKEYDGAIRWGGDYSGRKDEMHFEINASKARVAAVARKIRGGSTKPPSSAPERDVTIVTWSLKFGAGLIQPGGHMRTADATWLDIRAFMAWARRLNFITAEHEAAWVNKTSHPQWINWTGANALVLQAVKAVQRKNKLAADGVFGPRTGALMARYGYHVVVNG